GQDTDADGVFTVDQVACLGCCTIAPAVQIDDVTYGHVTTEDTDEILKDFLVQVNKKDDEKPKSRSPKHVPQGEIRIGLGSCCVASGSAGVKEELEQTLSSKHINVDVKHVGCVGVCNQVPLLEIHKEGQMPAFYAKVQPDEVQEIVHRHFQPKSWYERLSSRFSLFMNEVVSDGFPKSFIKYDKNKHDTPLEEFLKPQRNIATEHHGVLSPTDIDEYKRLGGFQALKKCVTQYQKAEIVEIIKESGLRGRGGGGFHSWKKWKDVQEAKSDKKYIICNGDEGDPGAFMDRMLLESYPFRILEGVIIAAYTVGANEGILYIRSEYPLAVIRINQAIEACRNAGLLGENILDSGFSFDLQIFEGAGAF
ncbi:MAG TPA: NAD(P)H-dependent oxidoreductase subunit E, partial [Bacteroidales bacterium]|nr:NAD(P)H-dependent oxidoreductase subunit E [Bacteroidales bacterium]